MKMGILRVGQVDLSVVSRIKENLDMIFPKATCTPISESLLIPEEAFNAERKQYSSRMILHVLHGFAEKEKALDCVLGIADMDLFVPELSFVFGEAEFQGKAALISLWRLKPEYYKKPPNLECLVERSTKEAVHELGHVLGLEHCSNPFCVMYFSNSIFETDRKQSFFCNKCYLKAENAMNNLG